MPTSNLELPMPPFTPDLKQAFRPLCIALPETKIADLAQEITAHVQAIKDALSKNEFLDLPLAEAIAHALLVVLPNYGQYSPLQQALIVGAARYFIDDEDVEPDTTSVLGLDDDAEVLNYVLETIGRADLTVEV